MRAEWELRPAPDPVVQRPEHLAVDRARLPVPSEQRAQVVLGVVALGQLEDRPAGGLGEPDDRADLELRGPLDLVHQPRGRDPREVGGRRRVAVERRRAVALQEGRRDLVVHLALDRAPHDGRLVLPGGEDRDLARGEDRRDAHRDRFARHRALGEEAAGRVASRDAVEEDPPRAAVEPGTGLVEADVPRLADAEQLEVDAPGRRDRRLVRRAMLGDALGGHGAVQQVHLRLRDVDLREEVRPHEPVVRVRTVRRHREVLVEIERLDLGEAQPLLAVHPDELPVDADRRGAGREAEHGAPTLGVRPADRGGDALGDFARERAVVLEHPRADPFPLFGGGNGARPASLLGTAGLAHAGRALRARPSFIRHRSGREARAAAAAARGVRVLEREA